MCYDRKMNTSAELEPGIIKTFGRFTWVRLVMFLFSAAAYLLTTGSSTENILLYLAASLLDVGLLLVYLSLPRLRRLLKSAYLPIGICWSAVGPMLQVHYIFGVFVNQAADRSASLLFLQSVLVLFIPLVVTAWRYSMRGVIIFCGLTFLLDGLFVLSIYLILGSALSSHIFGVSFLRSVLFLFIGNLISNLVKVQLEQHQRLAQANERLAQYAATLEQLTISRERNRMARELHDVMAHTMSGVAVELEGVRAMLRVDPLHAEELLGQSLKAVREGLGETRRALQALRASPIEDLGLSLAICNLAESIAGRAGLQTDLRIENEIPDFPMEVQQCFYRVTQEALTNVVAHAQASWVQISLACEGPLLKLSIRDNGVGFEESSMDLDQKYGLLGMRERVEMINGSLSITSKPGSGTQILLTYKEPREGYG